MNQDRTRPSSSEAPRGGTGSRDRDSLTAIPVSWISWSYELRAGDAAAGTIVIPWLGEQGTFTSSGRSWTMAREAWLHGSFLMKQAGRSFATADKPGAFFRSFQVSFDNEYFIWEAESPWGRSFLLRKGNAVIGSMRPVHTFSRRAAIDLPDDLSLERKAFLVWLALLMWRRHQSSN
ncbi:MAG: hypothetical protein ABIP42_07415 [Planctomycetota bacterium]